VRDKLAIVGAATRTRDDVPYDDPNLDIWMFNEMPQKDYAKRCDAVFQLHEAAIWKNPLNRGGGDHGAWLMSGNTPTVYMLEQYPEVPKCVKYPKDEIVEALLPNFTVDSERARKDFFTSTIAYSFALGIYLGYKEIHTYGVELADEDEYRQQQPAAMFWTGIAIGRGVKWVSHSQMFDAPLYPAETFIGLDKKIFTEQITALNPGKQAANAEYIKYKGQAAEAIKHYEQSGAGVEEMTQAIKAQAEAGNRFGVIDGAIQENERFFGRADAMEKMTGVYVFSKHEFNRDQAAIGVRREQAVGDLNNTAVELQKIINRIDPKRFDSQRRKDFVALREQIEAYVKAAVVVGMYTGAINEDERFMSLLEAEKKKLREQVKQ
jgi:hypothetical protein